MLPDPPRLLAILLRDPLLPLDHELPASQPKSYCRQQTAEAPGRPNSQHNIPLGDTPYGQ